MSEQARAHRVAHAAGVARLRVQVRGAVQGVGFRPFVYRLARDLRLPGWVLNSASGVTIEVEGSENVLDEFLVRLQREKPPRAVIQGLEASRLDPAGFEAFEIKESQGGAKRALVLPDIATCPDCLSDIFDPSNRRYRYPFTNCTNCGPRFTIIRALPYDRPHTTMARFAMCERCRAEYEDPLDRRFHAQPNACPTCGPQLSLRESAGTPLREGEEALREAERLILDGAILAMKGLGGFHLVVDARNDEAVRRLRLAKAREEKPFALMLPDLDMARRVCEVGPLEARALESAEAPIVLMRRRSDEGLVAASVAPHHPLLGVMLPYTPLHHLLMRDLHVPVVATSGNRADEPICIDEDEAVERLAGLADAFLVHDRPIVRPVDDSIVRVVAGRELVMRRARGFAPMPVTIGDGQAANGSVLGVGAHLKNTVSLSVGGDVFISQHLGDLETPQASTAFERAIEALASLYEAPPTRVACDAHPDYRSTAYALNGSAQVERVQHHVAHVLACMAENELEPPLLGVSWDGTGYGLDGTVWGGEFFLVEGRAVRRVATFRPFPLPGSDHAVREPRRSAVGLLVERYGGEVLERTDLAPVAAFAHAERTVLKSMLARQVNAPRTSSVGRLFDAVASLAGFRHRVRYEGQAAMELESAALAAPTVEPYPFELLRAVDVQSTLPDFTVDWGPMLDVLLADLADAVPVSRIAARFHAMLAAVIVAVAQQVGQPRVLLSGGCFQNALLTEWAVQRLRETGFRPYWHQRVPPNDGGVSLGQVVAITGGYRLL